MSKGDYRECDITLTYAVLRNCAITKNALRPSQNWGIVPVQPGDFNLGDDLERIMAIRNAIYSHVATTDMSDSDYIGYMNELKDICSRMDTIHAACLTSATAKSFTYSQRLQDIKTCCMDPDTKSMYIRELKRLADEEETMLEKLEHLSQKQEDVSQKQEHLSEKLDDLSGMVYPLLL